MNLKKGGNYINKACRICGPYTHAALLMQRRTAKMDSNNWYSNQNYHPRAAQHSRRAPVQPVAADSAQDAHRVLDVYPMGSTTPSNHGEPQITRIYSL